MSSYPQEIIYLVLINNKDEYDFNKGAIDQYEIPFDCAVRETYEESGLKYKKNYLLHRTPSKTFSDGLEMFIGEYILDFNDLHMQPDLTKNISITPNINGIIEHKGFLWETYENARNKLPDYLKEVIDWAKNNI
jgi:8-oxo-dGTP pyrophosphatase MutT (NUDIX family)